MDNPWNEISLSDYENHMSAQNVFQLQTLSEMMKTQLTMFDADSVMILGVAGGNGLGHIDAAKFSTVCGVDVNNDYLNAVKARFANLSVLKCVCADLTDDDAELPCADIVIADLLIEYIGYECFKSVVMRVKPRFVSCGIQIDTGEGFVSETAYTHCFDALDSVHRSIDANKLTECMAEIGYKQISTAEYPLPNGKKLVKIDFSK